MEGEFVSLMISAAKPPYRTRLTFITKMDDFCCLKIADDIRQNAEKASLIGVAVMLSVPSD